jgi:hypothetical protein
MTKYLITLRGLDIDEKILKSILGRTARGARSATWDFGYPVNICCRTNENHGKTLVNPTCIGSARAAQ